MGSSSEHITADVKALWWDGPTMFRGQERGQRKHKGLRRTARFSWLVKRLGIALRAMEDQKVVSRSVVISKGSGLLCKRLSLLYVRQEVQRK